MNSHLDRWMEGSTATFLGFQKRWWHLLILGVTRTLPNFSWNASIWQFPWRVPLVLDWGDLCAHHKGFTVGRDVRYYSIQLILIVNEWQTFNSLASDISNCRQFVLLTSYVMALHKITLEKIWTICHVIVAHKNLKTDSTCKKAVGLCISVGLSSPNPSSCHRTHISPPSLWQKHVL